MALISVVIPCYNAGRYIVSTLTALEKQTFKDFNVILADDCSTDDTALVIEEYAAQSPLRLLYTKNDCNSGPAVSRNNAIALSDATYICCCDSDDWYDEDYLANMAAAAQESRADIVLCGHRVTFENGKPPLQRPLPCEAGKLSKENALLLNVDALWCVMVKRELAQSFPLPNLRNGEDMAVIPVWMMHAKSFAAVPQPMYNYLLRQGSLSNKVTLKVVGSLEASFDNIKKNLVKEYAAQIEYIGIRNLVYGALLNLFKCGNDKDRARQILGDFEKDFPGWKENPYMDRLPLFKRIFVKAAANRRFWIVRLLTRVHVLMAK